MVEAVNKEHIKVLIVDDDIVDREMVKRCLDKADQNFECIEAENVDKGICLFESYACDVILLDYRMPQRDGIEMVRELRSHTKKHGSVIIMMSSAEDQQLAIECLEAGAQDFIPKSEITPKHILSVIMNSKTRFKLENKLRENSIKAMECAEKDTLTGLANRFVFEKSLQIAAANNIRYNQKLGLLLFDIDHFKSINDQHGHDVGDEVLRQVVNIISATLRTNELFCRLGGDEFSILVTHLNGPHDLSKISHRIINALKKPITINGIDFNVAISIGAAIHPEDTSDRNNLIKYCDIAMYRAKEVEGSKLCFFHKKLQEEFVYKYKLEHELECALDKDRLFLLYQPIFDPFDLQVCGFEALLRLRTDDQEVLLPESFIHIAEQSGIMVDIGMWVLSTAAEKLKQWNSSNGHNFTMSINMSSLQFGSASVAENITSYFRELDVSPKNIEFELTESSLLTLSDPTISQIHKLHDYGFRIALDDFGTGFLSISHLLDFPIDTVKLDKSMIPKDSNNYNRIKIINAIIPMFRELNMDIVAEGVEQEFQCDLIKKHHIHRAQGYLFDKPLTAEEIESKIFNH